MGSADHTSTKGATGKGSDHTYQRRQGATSVPGPSDSQVKRCKVSQVSYDTSTKPGSELSSDERHRIWKKKKRKKSRLIQIVTPYVPVSSIHHPKPDTPVATPLRVDQFMFFGGFCR